MKAPFFDFENYDPQKAWYFPAQRLMSFAYSAHQILSESRKKIVFLHRYPDFRFVVYHESAGLCSALLDTAMLMRAHEQTPEWWESQEEVDFEVNPHLADVKMQQIRHLASVGFVQSVVRLIDQAMRQFCKALEVENGEDAEKRKLTWVWNQVLDVCGQEQFRNLIKLWLILRDCLSTQEKFRPIIGKSLDVRYRGKVYHFDAKSEIDFKAFGFIDFWDMCLFLISELDELLMALYFSKAMQAIPFIRTPYLD